MQTLETFAPPAPADHLAAAASTAAFELFFLTKKGVQRVGNALRPATTSGL